MIANYHTHTKRCCHASGEDREYVEKAIAGGLKIFGFSDHCPYFFPDGRQMEKRIPLEDFPSYCDAVRSLKEEMKDQLQIHLGIEVEYFPKYFQTLKEKLIENSVEYMLLGQHYTGDDHEGNDNFKPTEDLAVLNRFSEQLAEGILTGCYTYVAHPDVLNFVGDPKAYQREMRKVCRAAKNTDTPLEMNLLGIRQGRHYPNLLFWEIAAEEGCSVVFGCDAHSPRVVTDPESERVALDLVTRYQLPLRETVLLKPIG